MESRSRKWLNHDIPTWVDPSDEIYFITVCCETRGSQHLVKLNVANSILESLHHRVSTGDWYAFLFLIMPDHVHGILRFGPASKGMKAELRNWKSWLAKSLKIRWQDGFFEHRIRDKNSLSEKYEYILQNPVRAKLTENANDWPWKHVPED